MILPEIFLQLREKAIEKLDDDTKNDSFGYHIDVVDAWESIYNTTELLSYLCIHSTHSTKYSELSFHMKDFLKDISIQVNKHYNILNSTQKIINTANKSELINKTRSDPNFKYDLLEMGADWLFIKKYSADIKTVVDFGAGCGRQIIGCHTNLPNLKNYIGIDASLNGYTTQNLLYGTFSLLNNYKFFDLLDYEASNIDIKENKIFDQEKAIIHFPAWTDYSHITDNSIDLILACHVHNEISKSDFLRLMFLVEKKLSKNGIFYIRSELGIWSDTNYEDKVKYHGIDPVEYLYQKNIHIIETEYFGGFMTTVFCRKEGKFFKDPSQNSLNNLMNEFTRKINKKYRNSDHPLSIKQILNKIGITKENNLKNDELPIIKSFKEASFYCAKKYLYNEIERILKHYKNIQYVSETFDFGNQVIDFYKKKKKKKKNY